MGCMSLFSNSWVSCVSFEAFLTTMIPLGIVVGVMFGVNFVTRNLMTKEGEKNQDD